VRALTSAARARQTDLCFGATRPPRPEKYDVHLFVYDSSGAEVAKDDLPGPKCSVKVTPTEDGQYKFVITNAGGANTVTFKVKVAK
jgi:hypothetical protein